MRAIERNHQAVVGKPPRRLEMLRHTARLEDAAADIEAAIDSVLDAGYRTRDIARDASSRAISTSEMGELICDAVAQAADIRHAYHAV